MSFGKLRAVKNLMLMLNFTFTCASPFLIHFYRSRIRQVVEKRKDEIKNGRRRFKDREIL